AGKRKYTTPESCCNLDQNMRRRAKTVESQRLPLARHPVASPADKSCAEPRRNLRVFTMLSQRKAKARVGNHVGGKTSVPGVARKHRGITEVFSTTLTVRTESARGTQPRNTDALTYRKSALSCS